MANVSIKFNGKEFLLSCEDGQEEHLEELLIKINQVHQPITRAGRRQQPALHGAAATPPDLRRRATTLPMMRRFGRATPCDPCDCMRPHLTNIPQFYYILPSP